VAQDPLGAGAGVVADEEGDVGALEALHHGEGFAGSDDQLRAFVEVFEQDVAHPVVGLVYEELRRAATRRALDGGVHVGGQEAAEAFVLAPARDHVLRVRHAGNALHVRRDKDPHASPLDVIQVKDQCTI